MIKIQMTNELVIVKVKQNLFSVDCMLQGFKPLCPQAVNHDEYKCVHVCARAPHTKYTHMQCAPCTVHRAPFIINLLRFVSFLLFIFYVSFSIVQFNTTAAIGTD